MLHVLGFQAASRAARPVAWALAGLCVLVLAAAAGGASRQSVSVAGGSAPLRAATITQGFGCTSFVLEPFDASCPQRHFHSGIDLAAPLGTPVYSVSAGSASVIDSRGGYGVHVLVTGSDGTVVLYGHLEAAAVPSGAEVAAGALLGWIGSTGNSSGPHLHFEVRRFGHAVDPSPWLPDYGSLQPPSSGGKL